MNWLTRLRVRKFVQAFKRWLEDFMKKLPLIALILLAGAVRAESPRARAKAALALAQAPVPVAKSCPCDCPCSTGSVCDCRDACKCDNCPGVRPYRWEAHSSGHWLLLYVNGKYVGAWCSHRQAYFVDGYKAELPVPLPASWKPKAVRRAVAYCSSGG